MRAVAYEHPLPIEDERALLDVTMPEPTPGPRDLLVRIAAVSVNPVDTKVRRKQAPPPGERRVLGWDAAGTVRTVGADVTLFRPGDRVYYAGALERPGTNSELHAVDERIVGRMPASLGFAEAAAMPLTAITAWELLFDRLAIPRGEGGDPHHLLAIGASGGVGSILVQLARKLTNAVIVGTASRPETRAWVLENGAHHVIDRNEPLASGLRAIGIPFVRYIASLVGTQAHFGQIVEAIAPQGRLAVIDDPSEPLDTIALKRKSASLHWEFMFTRSMFETPDMIVQHELLNEVAALVDAGEIRTTLAHHFGRIDAGNLRRAHAFLESGKAHGKIVLEGFE